MSGNDVKLLQQELMAEGYKITDDGQFGVKTEAALKDYQQKKGLVADGIAGSKTKDSIGLSSASPSTQSNASGNQQKINEIMSNMSIPDYVKQQMIASYTVNNTTTSPTASNDYAAQIEKIKSANIPDHAKQQAIASIQAKQDQIDKIKTANIPESVKSQIISSIQNPTVSNNQGQKVNPNTSPTTDIKTNGSNNPESWWREGPVREFIFDNVIQPYANTMNYLTTETTPGKFINRLSQSGTEFATGKPIDQKSTTGSKIADGIADNSGKVVSLFVSPAGAETALIYNGTRTVSAATNYTLQSAPALIKSEAGFINIGGKGDDVHKAAQGVGTDVSKIGDDFGKQGILAVNICLLLRMGLLLYLKRVK